MRIAIAGGTGFVGSLLVEKLHSQGDHLVIFTRNPQKAQQTFPKTQFPQVELVPYTPKQSGDWQKHISGCDAVVNLAGESLAEGRWTDQRKREIVESRETGTQKIVEAIENAPQKPSVLINASAIGYYGTSETETFDEHSSPGDDFLANVCKKWEYQANQVKKMNVRLVIFRLGIVLGNGGAIAKLIPPFKFFAGGTIGSGKQWFSWIHREDITNLIIKALKTPEMSGVYNATSPNPVRMEQLCNTIGEVINRPSWLPVPSFVIETILGDGAVVVLEGQQVLPKETQSTGFEYQYPELKAALAEILH